MGSSSTTTTVLVAVTTLAMVGGDYMTYLKVGQHARQMQVWKITAQTYLTSVNNLAVYLRSDTNALNATLEAAKSDVEGQASSLNTLMDNMLTKLAELEANSSALPPEYEAPPAAFQAYVATDGIQPLAVSYITFKYNDVVLNDGDHYSSSTGLFTAPVTGLYWFHAALTVSSSSKHEVYFKKTFAAGGTENVAYLNFYNGQETSCTTVTLMHPGDKMGIYPTESTFENWDLPGGEGNTFAGYLVARYDDPDYVPGDSAATTAATDGATTNSATTGL